MRCPVSHFGDRALGFTHRVVVAVGETLRARRLQGGFIKRVDALTQLLAGLEVRDPLGRYVHAVPLLRVAALSRAAATDPEELMDIFLDFEEGLAFQCPDVSLVGSVVDESNQIASDSLMPGDTAGFLHLFNQIGHDLVIGRHRLGSPFVVKFPSIVIRRIVGSRNIQPTIQI